MPTHTERAAPGRIDYRRLPINSNNQDLVGDASFPASQPAYYCTASPRCYSVLSLSVSCLCFWAGCSSNNTLIGASTVLLCIPQRETGVCGNGIFGPPATRSNPAARPRAPVAVLLAAAASHNARASPLWSPPPLEQQTGPGATAKAEAKTKAGGMNDVTQSHAWQFGLFGQFAAHFSST